MICRNGGLWSCVICIFNKNTVQIDFCEILQVKEFFTQLHTANQTANTNEDLRTFNALNISTSTSVLQFYMFTINFDNASESTTLYNVIFASKDMIIFSKSNAVDQEGLAKHREEANAIDDKRLQGYLDAYCKAGVSLTENPTRQDCIIPVAEDEIETANGIDGVDPGQRQPWDSYSENAEGAPESYVIFMNSLQIC